METVRYVVRFFKDDQYLYSVHCDALVLDQLVSDAKVNGRTVKVLAYFAESEENNG